MTKIIVDMKELAGFQKNLASNAEEFDNITRRMTEIVEALKDGWQGYDAHNFITNSSAYLHNLKQIRDILSDEADLISRRSKTYTNRIDDFYTQIGGKEDGNK